MCRGAGVLGGLGRFHCLPLSLTFLPPSAYMKRRHSLGQRQPALRAPSVGIDSQPGRQPPAPAPAEETE